VNTCCYDTDVPVAQRLGPTSGSGSPDPLTPPNAWRIVNGRLHLNYDRSVARTWAKE
jgi:hypothetical protein